MLNLRGEVIGIATAVNATGQGIGFAIPINMAKEIVGHLREAGRVVRSWLGVAVREPTPSDTSEGVVVTEVAEGGPAAAAGVRVGDVITVFEGHAIRTPARLRWYVATAGVGRSVEVRVRRGSGPEQSVRVSLSEVPAAEQARAQARAALGGD
jgi:serine protease Do